MNPTYTDITLVIDRSGSMDLIRADAEGGVNAFITEQAEQPGRATLTVVQFDHEYEFLHRGIPVQSVPPYALVPRGMTALLDGVGRAIKETGERLANLPEEERPGLVIFVVVTDGQENASREFSMTQIKEMISHQQDTYGWNFTFLAANQEAFAEAGELGIDSAGVAAFDHSRVFAAYHVLSGKVARMRAQTSSGETVTNEFTEEDRQRMLD